MYRMLHPNAYPCLFVPLIYTESCGATASERTRLHANTSAGHHRSSSYGTSSISNSNDALSVTNILGTSPTTDGRSGYLSSNISTATNNSHGNASSATTPMMSNLTDVNVIDINEEGGRGSDGALPPMPSMSSQRGASISTLPPRHRPGGDNSHSTTSTNSNNNQRPQQQQPQSNISHSLGSRIKMNTTLGLLIVGLLLCIATLTRYVLIGPSSSSPVHHTRVVGNTSNRGGENDDSVRGDEYNVRGKLKDRRAMADELFDELGRYIIEDYDARPTFSNFLPVSLLFMFVCIFGICIRFMAI